MKSTKAKFIGLILGLILIISLSAFFIMLTQNNTFASADTLDSTTDDGTEETNKYFISDGRTKVEATYTFVYLNDTECSVKIANKAEATVAVIPNKGTIDGKEYTVTEIASNGFASSPKLERVRLSSNIKKINNSAFSNCAELKFIDLNRVEAIGSSVFYKCTNLQDIRIPETVISVGSNTFRNNETCVHFVGNKSTVEENWTSTWNKNNSIEEVDYNTAYLDPIPLDEIYSENLRGAEQELIGYAYSSGQPTNFSYKKIETYSDGLIGDGNDYREGDNIIIPAICEDDRNPILKIASYAFEDVKFDKCIIEYFNEPIEIESSAFCGAKGKEVIINREITFFAESEECTNIFSDSEIVSLVLPNTLTMLPESMCSGCTSLKNIFFQKPNETLSKDDLIISISNLIEEKGEGIVDLPQDANFVTIGESAFNGTTSISKLNIYDNVLNIGASAVSGWTDEQTVHVCNTKAVPKYDEVNGNGWHPNWHDDEFRISYEHYFFIIYLDPNEGTLEGINEIQVELNVKIGELQTPTREGYRFDGWFYEETKYDSETVYKYEKGITLSAKWSKLYPIELKSTDGKITYYIVNAVESEELPLKDLNDNTLEIPKEDGKEFKGFLSEDRSTKYYDENMKSIKWYNTEHRVLYADWETVTQKQYDIKYIIIDDNMYGYSNPNPVNFNQENVEKDNIIFQPILLVNRKPIQKIYWSLNSIKEADPAEYLETGKLTVYGYVVEPTAHLTFVLNGGTINTDKSTLEFGDTLLDRPIKLQSNFDGWLVNNKLVYGYTYNEVGNSKIDEIELVAQWSPRGNIKQIGIPSNTTRYVVTTNCTIRLSSSFINYCCIYINSDVNEVYIYSNASRVNKFYMYIETGQRYTELNLHLENLELVPPNDHPGIKVAKNGKEGLNLKTYGTVIIHGGNGSNGDSINRTGRDGCPAIECDKVILSCGDDLRIIGGNGGKEYMGGNYGKGGYAIDANEIRLTTAYGNKIGLFGGDGFNYTAIPYPTKAIITYF